MSEPLSAESLAEMRESIALLETHEQTSGVPIWWALGRTFDDAQVRGLLTTLAERDAALEAVTRERDAIVTAGDALAAAVEKALPSPDDLLALNALVGAWWAVERGAADAR